MRATIGVTMCLAVVCCGWPALAEDLYPPPWDSSLPNQTTQVWEVPDIYVLYHPLGGPLPEEILPGFSSSFDPTTDGNPYGYPVVQLDVYVPPGVTGTGYWEWEEVLGPDGETNIVTWHYNGDAGTQGKVTITIPNNKDENLYKDLFYQVTADGSISPTGDGPFTEPAGSSQPLPSGYESAHQWPNSSWYTWTGYMRIVPNPEEETFTFYVVPCTNIGEIVIDTVCAPEPASVGLLLFGAAGLLVRRRR